jgi:hypothetical protein
VYPSKNHLDVLAANLTSILPLLDWQCRQKEKRTQTAAEASVLPPFIIDQIRRREEQHKRRSDRPTLELPVDMPAAPRNPEPDEDERDRGVLIVDLG